MPNSFNRPATTPLFRKVAYRLVALFLIFSLSGCASHMYMDPEGATTLRKQETLRSGACAIFPMLDRTPIRVLEGLPAGPDPDERILAGFWTEFVPGAPPIACDKLHQMTRQGVFLFPVQELPLEVRNGFRGAFVEINGFDPISISIEPAPPWDLGFGEGWAWREERLSSCHFQIALALEQWAPGMTGWRQPAVDTGELAIGEQRLRMRNHRSRHTIDVTSEVRAWLRNERPNLGFALMPAGREIMYKADNDCMGLFSLRLLITYERDERE